MIERAWGPVSKKFSNYILDPEEQIILKDVPASAKPSEKINKPFLRKCQDEVLAIMENFEFDGHKWSSGKVDPDTQNIEFDGEDWEVNNDQELLHEFHVKNLSKKNRMQWCQEHKVLYDEIKYVESHADIRKHSLFISRCFKRNCKPCVAYHRANPLPGGRDFPRLIGLPDRERNGALAGVNTPDPENEGHYKTFLQELEDLQKNQDSKILPDSDLTDGPKSRCEVIITVQIKDAEYFMVLEIYFSASIFQYLSQK